MRGLLTVAAALASFAVGCEDSPRGADGAGGSGAVAGASGDAGEGGAGEAGSGGTAPITCAAEAGDHRSCTGSHCSAIGVDQVIECDDGSFARYGHRVALIGGTSYVATTTLSDARLFELAGSSIRQVDEFPLERGSRPVALAVGNDSTLYALSDESEFAGAGTYEGGLVLASRGDGSFSNEVLASSRERMLPFYELLTDAAGRPHVFYSDEGGPVHLQPGASGSWQAAAVSAPGDGWERFSVTPDGEVVAFGYSGDSDAWQLLARFGDETRDLGSAYSSSYPNRYRPFPPSRDAGGPTHGAVISRPDSLGVAWVGDGAAGFAETELPGGALPELSCPEGFTSEEPPCPSPCVETTSGVAHEAFAVSITGSHAYVAFATSHIDRDIAYEAQNIDGRERCVGNVAEDRSTSELLLTRVAFEDGSVEPLLALPIGDLGRDVLGSNEPADAGPVALWIDGNALAVSVRTGSTTSASVRVLHVELAD